MLSDFDSAGQERYHSSVLILSILKPGDVVEFRRDKLSRSVPYLIGAGTLLLLSAGCDSTSRTGGDSLPLTSAPGGPYNPGGSSSGGGTSPPTSPSSFSYNSAGSVPDDYNIGMNMPGNNYYNNAAMYADVTLQMSANDGRWDTQNPDAAATLDSTGAPTVAAWAGFTSDYLSGQYTLTWDGTGSFTISGAQMGTKTVTTSGGVQHNSVAVTWTANPSTTGSNWTEVTTTPPVTNIHFMVPTSNQVSGSLFTKDFLTKIAPFSTLRFMDALNTNGNTISAWSQRTWPSQGSRGGTAGGIAYEDIINLANTTGKDVWVNIPVRSTDDYVCRLARLFRYGESGSADNGSNCSLSAAGNADETPINGTSHVYLEYANEIWNEGFPQWVDLYCMANAGSAPSGKSCSISAPTSAIAQAALATNSMPWSTGTNKTTQLSLIMTKRDNDIFKEVFGSRASQIRSIHNVQAAWAAEVDPGFSFMKQVYGSVTASVDYMAVAPYFGNDNDSYADTSVTAIFTDMADQLMENTPVSGGSSIYQWLVGDLQEANEYGLPVIAYEGGQGLSPNYTQDSSSELSTAVANDISAQFNTQMYTLTQSYFALWDQLVGRGHLFNYYSLAGGYSQYGMWGSVVNTTDPGSQKYDAAVSLILNPGDANEDGVVNQADCAILQANWGKTGMFWTEGDFNHDGTVNAEDLAILNAHISGAPCTAP